MSRHGGGTRSAESLDQRGPVTERGARTQVFSDDSVAVLGDLLGLRPVAVASDDETHRAFPTAANPRFYVPTETRRAAAASCLAYNRLRPPAVARRRAVVGWGLGSGVLQRVQGTAMTSGPPTGRFAGADEQLVPLLHELARRLGRDDLSFATSPRNVDPFWTPTLQLFALDGTPVAYAKVGWTELTRAQVETEADVLHQLVRRKRSQFASPTLLERFEWGDTVVSVTAPMPADVVRMSVDDGLRPEALLEVAGLDGPPRLQAFASSGGATWADALVAARPAGLDSARRDAWDRFADAWKRAAELIADLPVPLGRWHGDWVPWNLAWSGASLWVWDWEYSGADRPVGLDAYHWHYQQLHVTGSVDVARALQRSRILGAQSLDSLGVGADTGQGVACAHVLELAARLIDAARAGAPGHLEALGDLPVLCDELVNCAKAAAGGGER